jgi:hypothetical protein
VGDQRVGDVGVHHDCVDVDHRADGVQVHGRPFLRDRHGQHGVGEAALEDASRQSLDARRRGALANPHCQHAGGEKQHVATLDVFQARLVHASGAGEARVVGVDRAGECRLALARRHRQARHGDLVAHPHARVAGKKQIRQRIDDEVMPVHQRVRQPAARA